MKHVAKEAGAEGGFTIIELIIVILILAILVSIAMLSVVVIRRKTQEAACRANLRTLVGVIKQYEVANDITLPSNLDALVTGGFLKKLPKCEGLDYQYDSTTGEVTCPNGHEL